MKKALFAILTVVSLNAFALPASGQFLKKVTDRIAEKVDQRASQKAEETIDQALDQTAEQLAGTPTADVAAPPAPATTTTGGGTPGDCKNYYLLRDHGTMQITTYDADGKATLTLQYTIIESHPLPQGKTTQTHMEAFDENGTKINSGTITTKCINGSLFMDMRASMPYRGSETEEQMQAQGQAVAFLQYPPRLSEGQHLPNATFQMNLQQQGSFISSATFTIKNRKVEGKENVTTPAGTWSCYRISYTATIRVLAIGFRYQVTEWYAPGFGIVRSQSRNKKGKMVGYSELTKIQP